MLTVFYGKNNNSDTFKMLRSVLLSVIGKKNEATVFNKAGIKMIFIYKIALSESHAVGGLFSTRVKHSE